MGGSAHPEKPVYYKKTFFIFGKIISSYFSSFPFDSESLTKPLRISPMVRKDKNNCADGILSSLNMKNCQLSF